MRMNKNGEQNGRQATPHSPATAPPTDPRRRNVSVTVPSAAPSDKPQICRDNIWGICSLGSQCRYRHQLDYESMRAVLKFCHEFQNRTGCNRADCTYLHTSKEEENLFLTSGVVPRVLAERYAAMARMSGSAEGVPGMFEYVQQPPLPPVPGPAAALPAPASAALAPLTPFLAPPPPPPPPTTTTTNTRNIPPIFTSPPATLQPAPVPQPPRMLPATFDPSRPPPPVPPQSRLKRPPDNCEAGPSCKLRVSEATTDAHCDTCVQREIRIQIYKQEMEKLQKEEEIQRLILKKKTEEYENGKLLLKSALGPQVYRILEDYMDSLTPNTTALSQAKPASFSSGTLTVPRQLLMQLTECVFGGGLSSTMDAVPSTSQQGDSLLQTLTALTRSENNLMNPVIGASSEVLQAILNAFRNNTSSEGAVAGASGATPVTNGVSRAAVGGGAVAAAVVTPPSVPVRAAAGGGAAPRYPGTSPRYAGPPRLPLTSTAPPPPPAYMAPVPAAAPGPAPSARPYYMPYGEPAAVTPAPPPTPATYNGTLRPPPTPTPSPHVYPHPHPHHHQFRYPPYYPPAPPHQ